MSIIGPRPLLVEYLPYYTEEEHHRHDVRPGLSGWAQINGRNAIDSWEQRFAYDIEYVNNLKDVEEIIDLFDERYTYSEITGAEYDTSVKTLAVEEPGA